MAEKTTEVSFSHGNNDTSCDINDKKTNTQIKTQWLKLAFSDLDISMQ